METTTLILKKGILGKGRLLPELPTVARLACWRVVLEWPDGIETVEARYLPDARQIYREAYRRLVTSKVADYHLRLERVKMRRDAVTRNEVREGSYSLN
jgi:hypothetical protein